MKLQLGVIQCTSFHHLLRLQSGAKSQTPLRAKSSPPVPGKAVTPGLERRLHKGPGRLSSQSSLRDPTQVPTSVEIQVPGGAGGRRSPSASSAPGPEAPPGEAREAAPAPASRARELQRAFRPRRGEANTDTSVSFSTSAFKPGGGRHLSAPGRPRSPLCERGVGVQRGGCGGGWVVAGQPQLQQLSARGLSPEPAPAAPRGGRSRGAGRGGASRGAAPRGAGATRGRTRGARAGAATGRRGEPPTSPTQGGPDGRRERGCGGRRAGADAERPGQGTRAGKAGSAVAAGWLR